MDLLPLATGYDRHHGRLEFTPMECVQQVCIFSVFLFLICFDLTTLGSGCLRVSAPLFFSCSCGDWLVCYSSRFCERESLGRLGILFVDSMAIFIGRCNRTFGVFVIDEQIFSISCAVGRLKKRVYFPLYICDDMSHFNDSVR